MVPKFFFLEDFQSEQRILIARVELYSIGRPTD
jgi:hypothetical protein